MEKVIIIADSHVSGDASEQKAFFQMLDDISRTSLDVVFLGDNLDLWIAASSKYEQEMHHRFLDWCKAEKARRRVIYVEGNHEFYLCRHHRDCFTDCTEGVFRLGKVTFLHGDMIFCGLKFHPFFRLFAKNWFGDFMMSWLPFGVAFARRMKGVLAHKPGRFYALPNRDIARWSLGEAERYGTEQVIMGHFHRHRVMHITDKLKVTIVPAWRDRHQIGLLDLATGRLRIGLWRMVLAQEKGK